MTVEFLLFDVDHGQSAGIRLPNGRWCVFDVGCTSSFSPVAWIAQRERFQRMPSLNPFLPPLAFKFLKATVSHLHGDHLDDQDRLFQYGPEFIRTVDFDQQYLQDAYETASRDSCPKLHAFASHVTGTFGGQYFPDYGGVSIRELSLPVSVARQIGGAANSRVNNASVVTRIDVYNNSILLCGDLETDAWQAIIADRGHFGQQWRPFLSGIDVLIAPHHGHTSGYSADLLALAKPAVVLISVVCKDPHVDCRYSQDPVCGIKVGNTDYRSITTRKHGNIKLTIAPPTNPLALGAKGSRTWAFGNAAIS